jgi:predicted nucleic acid-binding protein
MHYLDTSVLTAYYCPEARSARVHRILSTVEGPTVSPLVEVELYGAVSRKVRAGDLDASSARRVFSQFQLHLAEPRFHLVPIHAAEYDLARDWIAQLSSPLRVLDGLHMATAFAHDLCLLTADKALARAARHFGVKCKLIA